MSLTSNSAVGHCTADAKVVLLFTFEMDCDADSDCNFYFLGIDNV